MLTERKILLVVNPISGDLDKDLIIEGVIERAKLEAYDLRIYFTSGVEDESTIREMVLEQLPERVLVAGGDGTVTMTAQAISGIDVLFGILPSGSANGLAVDFGLIGTLSDNIDIAFGSKSAQIDAISINDRISLHLSDIGMNALLVKNYENSDRRGKIGYAREMLKTLNDHERFTVRITSNDSVTETEAFVLIIANASKYGTGVKINPVGDMSDGKFEIIAVKKLDFFELAKILTGITDFNQEYFEIISAEYAFIECVDKDVYFQIDGEYQGTVRQLTAKILKKYVRVMIP